ncbi:uncharacterized protein UTRI_03593 [Ustilago trichophora]|uniref:Uncharacterized protein n=1 Tax=Ustilago trichophora TaxID=86804 RepID=A0A5C3E287_9BASI|nr:uncharacterized protein UTRI_03593 [Ustilago trichophora]
MPQVRPTKGLQNVENEKKKKITEACPSDRKNRNSVDQSELFWDRHAALLLSAQFRISGLAPEPLQKHGQQDDPRPSASSIHHPCLVPLPTLVAESGSSTPEDFRNAEPEFSAAHACFVILHQAAMGRKAKYQLQSLRHLRVLHA